MRSRGQWRPCSAACDCWSRPGFYCVKKFASPVCYRSHRTGGRQKRRQANATRKDLECSVKMYVARIPDSRDHHYGSAKPCAECDRWMKVCASLGIRVEVFYTTELGTVEAYDGKPSQYKLKTRLW